MFCKLKEFLKNDAYSFPKEAKWVCERKLWRKLRGTEVAMALYWRQILTKFRDSSVKVFERTPSQSGGKHTNSTETATGAWICYYKCSPNLSCQMSLNGIRYFVTFSSSQILLFHFSHCFNFLNRVLLDFAFLSFFHLSSFVIGFMFSCLEAHLHKCAAPVFVQLSPASCWTSQPCSPPLLVRWLRS